MHLLKCKCKLLFTDSGCEPAQAVDVDEPGDADDDHCNEEEEIGVGHFIGL